MELFEAIAGRRSIRKFTGEEIPRELLEQVLDAGRLAPSGKNAQPWKFVVATGKAKAEMLAAMKAGIERFDREMGLGLEVTADAKNTLRIMEEAPVAVLVVDPLDNLQEPSERIGEIINIQSVGAAIQNMLLAATALGLGSLWIANTFFAYDELTAWLGEAGLLVAAISIGYPAQDPPARPRKPLDQIVTWRE